MQLVYHVGQHDGGWAYRLENVWSEPHPTHKAAVNAAHAAARRQENCGRDTIITYETEAGEWIKEAVAGGDRPDTVVSDN
jgi:hypothetical protein